jgi:hypothetical protein
MVWERAGSHDADSAPACLPACASDASSSQPLAGLRGCACASHPASRRLGAASWVGCRVAAPTLGRARLAALFAPASSSSNPTRSRPRPRSRSMQAAAKLWSEARSRARAASCANKPRRRPAERLSRGLTCSSSCSGPDESLVLVAGRPLCLAVTADGDGFSPSLFRHTSCTWGRVSHCQASALPRQALSHWAWAWPTPRAIQIW